jgi:hypothetical protein
VAHHDISLKSGKLRRGLKIKVCAVETTASRHSAANFASLGEIIHIVSDDYVGIKWVSALPTIAIGIV